MKDLAAKVLDRAKNQRDQDKPFVRLVEVTLPNYRAFRVANYDAQISFEATSLGVPIVWEPFSVAFGDILQKKDGSLPQLQIGVSNASLELMAEIDAASGLTDQRVRVLVVNLTDLTNSAARVEYSGRIVRAECDQRTALFILGSPRLNDMSFPQLRVLSQCGVTTFGNPDCGYAIPDTTTDVVGGGFSHCDPRSLDACRERGDDEVARGLPRMHPRRMDGFPGTEGGNP